MSHEIKFWNCEMNVELKVSGDTSIRGEINNMTQVMNNIITMPLKPITAKEEKLI